VQIESEKLDYSWRVHLVSGHRLQKARIRGNVTTDSDPTHWRAKTDSGSVSFSTGKGVGCWPASQLCPVRKRSA
jgi:hypothetical protein